MLAINIVTKIFGFELDTPIISFTFKEIDI